VIPSLSLYQFCHAVAKSALAGFPNQKNDPINEYHLSINVFRFTEYFATRRHAVLISGALQKIFYCNAS
jgi:hypothetical protein